MQMSKEGRGRPSRFLVGSAAGHEEGGASEALWAVQTEPDHFLEGSTGRRRMGRPKRGLCSGLSRRGKPLRQGHARGWAHRGGGAATPGAGAQGRGGGLEPRRPRRSPGKVTAGALALGRETTGWRRPPEQGRRRAGPSRERLPCHLLGRGHPAWKALPAARKTISKCHTSLGHPSAALWELTFQGP